MDVRLEKQPVSADKSGLFNDYGIVVIQLLGAKWKPYGMCINPETTTVSRHFMNLTTTELTSFQAVMLSSSGDLQWFHSDQFRSELRSRPLDFLHLTSSEIYSYIFSGQCYFQKEWVSPVLIMKSEGISYFIMINNWQHDNEATTNGSRITTTWTSLGITEHHSALIRLSISMESCSRSDLQPLPFSSIVTFDSTPSLSAALFCVHSFLAASAWF